MTPTEAKKAGVKAFKTDKGRAPALNAEFVSAACKAATKGQVGLSELLEGYLRGWDVANLAEGMPADWPSVRALEEINKA